MQPFHVFTKQFLFFFFGLLEISWYFLGIKHLYLVLYDVFALQVIHLFLMLTSWIMLQSLKLTPNILAYVVARYDPAYLNCGFVTFELVHIYIASLMLMNDWLVGPECLHIRVLMLKCFLILLIRNLCLASFQIRCIMVKQTLLHHRFRETRIMDYCTAYVHTIIYLS